MAEISVDQKVGFVLKGFTAAGTEGSLADGEVNFALVAPDGGELAAELVRVDHVTVDVVGLAVGTVALTASYVKGDNPPLTDEVTIPVTPGVVVRVQLVETGVSPK